MSKHIHQQEECPYCEGNGYVQLLLGGTENCRSCESDSKWMETDEQAHARN